MISENMSLEEVYYGNTELIEAVLKTHKEWVDYHNTIANIMHKYQQIEKILNKDLKDYHPLDRNPIRLSLIREVVEDGSDTNS